MQVALVALLLIATCMITVVAAQESTEQYGVDTSFPMHYNNIIKGKDVNPLGWLNRLSKYQEFINGCRNYYRSRKNAVIANRCLSNEDERIEMNLRQPKEMQNYTSAGFAKVSAPVEVTKLLQDFWNLGKDRIEEKWPNANTYVNHWEVGTTMMAVSSEMESAIANLVRPVLEAWTGQSLVLTSVYGVRVYGEGAILAPHVDRLPLVTSCILNVAQDVDIDWPLEVVGHDGTATNVTAHPGEMILYESHSVIHGRPFALEGRYYANIFVHFEPHGYTAKQVDKGSEWVDEAEIKSVDEALYHRAEAQLKALRKQGEKGQQAMQGKKVVVDVPEYVDKEKEGQWRQDYVYQIDKKGPVDGASLLKEVELLSPHTAAALGKLTLLKEMEKKDPNALLNSDGNGWRPIHEAARSGSKEVLVYLIEKAGANVNERTNNGKGGTALFWAEQMLKEDHPAVQYLKSIGAKNITPLHPNSEEL